MLPTKLYHYSISPIEKLDHEWYKQDWYTREERDYHRQIKPTGFWVSVEDFEDDTNWKTWCEDNQFRLNALRYRYSVCIKNANILYLKTDQELVNFSISYSSEESDNGFIYVIRWKDVMEKYDGIIIAPYINSCRTFQKKTCWYYGWDCASGCIWNIDCLDITLDSIAEEIPECLEEENWMDLQ